jgi:predicted phage-related endonuclease
MAAMVKHFDEPDSPAWHARRARCFNAGDASAMLGCHPSGKTRSELLLELHTGLQREFSDYVQERVLKPGHRIEALWRPIAQQILGDDLIVLAATLDVGLSRPLGASLDGITFMEDILGECKSANDALRAALPHSGRNSYEQNDARQLPKGYRVQMEQQQLVTSATRTLFSACLFDTAGNVIEERHCWYTSDPALRAEILAGWKQLDADLAVYTPPAPSAVEKIVAEPVEALPAVVVRVEGSIVIHENFDAFEKAAREFLEQRFIREPRTDQHFADLEVQIKAMKGAEGALERAEDGWIAQITSVSVAKRRKDMLLKLIRDNRLLAERLLVSEKERRRGEIAAAGAGALKKHIEALNQRLGKPYMPAVSADFAAVIKGKRSLAAMENAVATELARAKIAANEIADRIQINLAALRELATEHASLFADTATLVLKDPDDCRAQITTRIAAHKAEQERKLEAERARIRAEEEARARAQAQREQQERQEAENALVESFHRAARRIEFDSVPYIKKAITSYESTAKDWENDPRERVRSAYLAGRAYLKDRLEAAERRQREEAEAAERERQRDILGMTQPAAYRDGPTTGYEPLTATQAAPGPAVIPMPTRAPAAATKGEPTLRLGIINERLAPVSISGDGLAKLGFPYVKKDRASLLYHEQDWPAIKQAIAQHALACDEQSEEVA